MLTKKDIDKILLDRSIKIGAEFEFIVPHISKSARKNIKKWTAISVAYYEYDVYEDLLGKYVDGIKRKPPSVPKYAYDLGYRDGDFIPDPDEVMKQPADEFLQLVDDYLRLEKWPIDNPTITPDTYFKDKSRWIIKPDYSLSDAGFEIVTPILSLKKFLEVVPKILKCIDEYGCTDKSCGLHFSLSINNGKKLNKVIDLIKLVTFIDEEYIYKLFHTRKDNDYAQSAHEDLLYNIEVYRKLKIDKGHWQAVNIQHLYKKNKYVEFRYLGGPNYQKKWRDIKKITAMYIQALKLACNNRNKAEYKNRIEKLFGGEYAKMFKV